MANRMLNWGKRIENFMQNSLENKFDQVESMISGIYLSSFVVIGWEVLTLPWGQVKLRSASVA